MDFSFSPKAKDHQILTSHLGFLLLYEDAIIETPHGFSVWRLISSCGASKYYLFSAVTKTKESLGLLACGEASQSPDTRVVVKKVQHWLQGAK